jgi:LPS export ABC transporter protein LptC
MLRAVTCHIGCAFSVLLLVLTSCSNDPQEIKKLTRKDTLPQQTATNVTLLYSDSARLKIKLTAPQIDEYAGSNPYTEMKKGVKVEFYDDSMKVSSSITSRYAIRRERDHTMEARNNVVVTNIKGERLETEQLIWDETRRIIYTKQAVKVTQADQIIHSEGLEADESFTNYTFKKVTGIFALPVAEENPK